MPLAAIAGHLRTSETHFRTDTVRTRNEQPFRISKSTVAKLTAPATGNKVHFDTEPRGFGVRVTAAGAKSYVLRYRNHRGQERRWTIGTCDAWEPEAARTKAKATLFRIENEKYDPLDEQAEDRAAQTVDELLNDYVESERFKAKAESTQAIDKGRLNRHVRPTLGAKVAVALTARDIEDAFGKIKSGKTQATVKTRKRGVARVTGGRGTAKKAMQLLGAALEWARIDPNPVRDVDLGRDRVRRLLANVNEYRAAFETLDAFEQSGEVRPVEADAIRVIILTGARRGEIAGLPRDYLNRAGDMLVLPPGTHKTGEETGEEKIIALPDEAQAIIQRQPAGPVIFPVDGSTLGRAWMKVRKAAGFPANFGLHGFRHSVASHLAMGGAEAAQIMTQLGHKDMATSQKYIHWAAENRKVLAERAALPALAGMRPKAPAPDAN